MSKSCIRTEGTHINVPTAYRRHTLKDQTDREEHCSTLVGLALFAKISFHHLDCICICICTLPRPSPGSVHVPLVGFDTRTHAGAMLRVVWCDVM
jgi:hypothetical protein